jgi:hypothetical protein
MQDDSQATVSSPHQQFPSTLGFLLDLCRSAVVFSSSKTTKVIIVMSYA